jgi:soluble lytic murein transglycosylase
MLLRAALLASFTVALVATAALHGQDGPADRRDGGSIRLAPTSHPALPSALSNYWLVSHPAGARTTAARNETPAQRFARGAQLIAKGDFAGGLPLVNSAELATTPLAGYSQYYSAVALMNLGRYQDAVPYLTSEAVRDAEGYLREGAAMRTAEMAVALNDAGRAVDALERIIDDKLLAPELALMQFATAAELAGDKAKALEAYRKLYYGLPLSAQAVDAQAAIARLEAGTRPPSDKFKKELARAEALYAARRWVPARAAFEPLASAASADDRALIRLRLAEIDYQSSRHRATRDALATMLDDKRHGAEARFHHLSAVRALGDQATYVRLARALVNDHPDSPWSEEALNNLASHYIVIDEEDTADQIFRQMVRLFPRGRYGDRAAWRIGWRAYRAGNYREAAEVFEKAAAAYPRADYRPSWIYWSGRAREQSDDASVAAERYALAVTDYGNSYYGRLAARALAARKMTAPQLSYAEPPAASGPVPSDAVIRELVSLQLYDDALREVQYAQRKWGDSPQLQATTAFIRHHQGLVLRADERFSAIRGAINTMRRAYPQFMAAGGDKLPAEVLRIIFPLDYWPLITKYSKQHGLDPYLIAALMAQESTFTAEIKSSANAIGLMQIIPSTGRTYARKVGIRNFTTNSLTNPETNVRLGTEYFKALMTRFGSAHYALASYNAGENRVQRWINERPPLPEDEFVDDIPFQETQTYVKRILGTAEDYRRLYGGGLLDPNASMSVPGATSVTPPPARPATPQRATPVPDRPSTAKPTTRKPAPAARSTAKPATRRR